MVSDSNIREPLTMPRCRCHFVESSQQTLEACAITIPILQIRKWRHTGGATWTHSLRKGTRIGFGISKSSSTFLSVLGKVEFKLYSGCHLILPLEDCRDVNF